MAGKILIVDDDFQNREILRARLEQAGYEVFESENGEDGLQHAVSEKYDLIILDVMMPKKDGWQVCNALKDHPDLKTVPIIFLTARAQTIDEMRSYESGAADYFTKPVDYSRLLESVNTSLNPSTRILQ